MISSDVALAGEFKADEIDFFLCQINERERERKRKENIYMHILVRFTGETYFIVNRSMGMANTKLSSCQQKRVSIQLFPKQVKKKVLILGLDRGGKTDLFTRLIQRDNPTMKQFSLPQPTIGYNVETIKIHRHEITLWDCGGQTSVRSQWSYHFSNTSLLLWLINIYDRSRLDIHLQLLSQILVNPQFNHVPVLIVLYENLFDSSSTDDETSQNLLTNLEIAFRFLATLSSSRASAFQWQVIHIKANKDDDFKRLRESFKELMNL